MLLKPVADLVGAGAFAALAAAAILWALGRWARPADGASVPVPARGAVFLFDGADLVDATPAARSLLRGHAERGDDVPDLARVLALLARDFGDDLPRRLADLPAAGRLLVPALDGPGLLEAQGEDGALRVTLHLGRAEADALARRSLDAALDELALLRALAEDAPQLAWSLDAAGRVAWANRAYAAAARLGRDAGPDGVSDGVPGGPDDDPGRAPGRPWPAVPIFDLPADLPEGRPDRRRLSLDSPDRPEPLWFEVTSLRRGEGSVHFAVDVGELVAAESARADLAQTLSKTFAQLDTGLAVFDRGRRLALFNPAFVDLTGLPAAFLAGRPLVHSVLDRLRDLKVLPEPRHYASWRDQVAALEAAAAMGAYSDTWTLPGGQTYRVTGRPFPDGALAFLFQDISDEVGLTRRFRAEIGAAQAALDAVDEAVATFSALGTLGLSNAAYAALWGGEGFGDATLADEAARWEAAAGPSPLWGALRAGDPAARGQLLLPDGRTLHVRAQALPAGGRLVAFRADPAPADAPASFRSRRPDLHILDLRASARP